MTGLGLPLGTRQARYREAIAPWDIAAITIAKSVDNEKTTSFVDYKFGCGYPAGPSLRIIRYQKGPFLGGSKGPYNH